MKRSEVWALAIATIIASLIEKSFALRCWSCNSQTPTEAFCDDPFDSSVVYRQNRRWSYIDCVLPPITPYNPYGSAYASGSYGGNGAYNSYESQNRLRPVCQKSRDRIDGRVFVHRKCAWVSDYDPYDKCLYDRTPTHVQREFCEYCDADGCNGAAQYGPIAALVVISATLLFKLSLF